MTPSEWNDNARPLIAAALEWQLARSAMNERLRRTPVNELSAEQFTEIMAKITEIDLNLNRDIDAYIDRVTNQVRQAVTERLLP